MGIESQSILDRELSRAAISSYRTHASPALSAVVDQGIAVFERASSSATGKDENIGALFPALHVFEMLDGAGILLHEGATAPARLPLRSAFEASLFVQYVTETNSAQRGAAYVVEDVYRRMANLARFDPKSEAGKQLRSELQKDPRGSAIKIPEVADLQQREASLHRLLAKPHLAAAASEYERLKKKTKKRPAFYNLWGGPSNIQELARHLSRSGEYEILYRTWSLTAHGADLGRQLTEADGHPSVQVFRSAEEIATAYSLAFSFGLRTIRELLNHYRPDELTNGSFARWYVREIQPVFRALPINANYE